MFIYIIFECEKKQSSQMRQQVKERIKLGFFLHLRRSHLVRTLILIGKSLDVNVSIKQQIEIDLEIENAIPSSNYAIASFTWWIVFDCDSENAIVKHEFDCLNFKLSVSIRCARLHLTAPIFVRFFRRLSLPFSSPIFRLRNWILTQPIFGVNAD